MSVCFLTRATCKKRAIKSDRLIPRATAYIHLSYLSQHYIDYTAAFNRVKQLISFKTFLHENVVRQGHNRHTNKCYDKDITEYLDKYQNNKSKISLSTSVKTKPLTSTKTKYIKKYILLMLPQVQRHCTPSTTPTPLSICLNTSTQSPRCPHTAATCCIPPSSHCMQPSHGPHAALTGPHAVARNSVQTVEDR